MLLSRRRWLASLSGALAGAGSSAFAHERERRPRAPSTARVALDLEDFQPKSMLHVGETKVARARFPVIDFHTHFGYSARFVAGVAHGEAIAHNSTPADLLAVMDRKNIRTMVNLTGGVGSGLESSLRAFQQPYPGRFVTFTEPRWDWTNRPNYPQIQADAIDKAHTAGAKGLKVLKTLGLYLRQNVTSGPLVKIDDARFDLLWDACGALRMPVAIHVSDPEAFFLPTDRFNERFEELNHHPDWSFYGKDYPSHRELLEARNRVVARHPRTQFVTLHCGNNAENLGYVSECLDRYPNMHVDIAARIGELGRQPRTARRFFEKYQDRIVFATDAVPKGTDVPQQLFCDELYEIYFRFLETEDEYFDYAPARKPPQGRWRIYGLGLPEPILTKVYNENAARLLGISS
jgi:predicted TIM-barrel fold metal-dependent hydrolase